MNWSWGSRLITGRIHVRWRAEAVPWWTESPPSTAPKATRCQMQFRLKRAFVGNSGVRGGGTQMCLTAEVWRRFKWVVPPEAGPEGPSLEPGKWDRGDAEGAALSPASEPRDDVWGGAAGEASAHSVWLYALGLYRAVLLDSQRVAPTILVHQCPWSRATAAAPLKLRLPPRVPLPPAVAALLPQLPPLQPKEPPGARVRRLPSAALDQTTEPAGGGAFGRAGWEGCVCGGVALPRAFTAQARAVSETCWIRFCSVPVFSG